MTNDENTELCCTYLDKVNNKSMDDSAKIFVSLKNKKYD